MVVEARGNSPVSRDLMDRMSGACGQVSEGCVALADQKEAQISQDLVLFSLASLHCTGGDHLSWVSMQPIA